MPLLLSSTRLCRTYISAHQVTGSNTGLGLEAARHFAKLKCSRLILAVRSTDKGENAKRSILYSHGVDGQKTTVEVWQLDMASFASVKAFAQRCERELSRLDIALLNAGLTPNGFKSTQDGYEQRLVSHFNDKGKF